MSNIISSEDLPKYGKHYSENGFWKKLVKCVKRAGAKFVYYALVLYYTLAESRTPVKYKAVIVGALGYLILPVDLVFDFLPGIGLNDDWLVLVVAAAYVAPAITPEIKAQAKTKLNDWFGAVDVLQLGDLA